MSRLKELADLRNRAVHGTCAEPTPTDALRYREIADRMVRDIRNRAE